MPYVFPIVIGLMILTYYYLNPFSVSFPIKCIWFDMTGTLCPACGTQRALHSFAHGHFWEALSYNYFFIFSLPYAFSAIAVTWYNYKGRLDRLKKYVFHSITLKTYVVMYFGWWIFRNIFHL